jgi:hypothetical protein
MFRLPILVRKDCRGSLGALTYSSIRICIYFLTDTLLFQCCGRKEKELKGSKSCCLPEVRPSARALLPVARIETRPLNRSVDGCLLVIFKELKGSNDERILLYEV